MHFHANGRVVHNLLAAAKVSVLLALIAIGFGLGNGNLGNLSGTHVVDAASTGWLIALVPIMFSLLRLERRGVRGGGDSRSRAGTCRSHSAWARWQSSRSIWH